MRNIQEIKANIIADDCILFNYCLIFVFSYPALHCSANQPPPFLLILALY